MDNLSKEIIYHNKFEINTKGIIGTVEVYANRICTSINATLKSNSYEEPDPVICTIPQKYAPFCLHRCLGFANLDLLVHENGQVQIQGSKGTFLSHGQTGYTYFHM